MATRDVGLRDVKQGTPAPRLRLLAPLRYLTIHHPEKRVYDFFVPAILAVLFCAAYLLLYPAVPLFGDGGLLRFARDLLMMGVPFMIGALAAVAMGSPGKHLDRRPLGVGLYLDGDVLTLRQFVCYLLGYLSFLGLIALIAIVGATLLHDWVVQVTTNAPVWRIIIRAVGSGLLFLMLSSLTVTVLWSLYFLTDVVNHKVDEH